MYRGVGGEGLRVLPLSRYGLTHYTGMASRSISTFETR